MRFELVDRVLDLSAERIVTLKQVSLAEEYLQDHFPTFPVLPGVMMLEAMVQAARLLAHRAGYPAEALPLVLGRVRALKYGQFVKPGAALRVEVVLVRRDGETFEVKGEGTVLEPLGTRSHDVPEPGQTAVSGRLTLRPARVC